MIEDKIQADIVNATVTLLKKGGRGVLVAGNLIVTAAHCIGFECSGSMVLGDYYIEEIETVQGRLRVTPRAVEPVSDVAVLGSLDDQEFYKDHSAFEEF